MVTAITKGIKITVEVEYQPTYSSPGQFHFVFTYRIAIENLSEFAFQLMHRHWYIHDANRQVKEVEGEGVVGLQPVLEPGESHTYVSGCNLKSGIGKMHGNYIMQRIMDGKQIKVKIPEFTMLVPYKLN